MHGTALSAAWKKPTTRAAFGNHVSHGRRPDSISLAASSFAWSAIDFDSAGRASSNAAAPAAFLS